MNLLKLIDKLEFKIHKQRYAADYKARSVYWYLLANGNQKLISEYSKTNYKLRNKRLWRQLMENTNLNDYAFCLEKDFKNYCSDKYTFVVKKKAD